MIDREDFIKRIAAALMRGNAKQGCILTQEKAVREATQIADKLPALFT